MNQMQTENNILTQCMAAETDVSGSAGGKKRFRLHPVTFAACALLLVLLFGAALHAVGMNMWRLIVTWDDETMDMLIKSQGKIIGNNYENDFYPPRDDAFFQKLEEMDIYPLLPSWMPEGFVLNNVENKIETEYLRWALGNYTYGDRQLQISITKDSFISGNPSIMKDEREPEIYERGGINFYILDNLKRSVAILYDPPYFVSICGHVSRDELKQMIDSMFERK